MVGRVGSNTGAKLLTTASYKTEDELDEKASKSTGPPDKCIAIIICVRMQ